MDIDDDKVDPKFNLALFRVPLGRVSLELRQSHLHRMTTSIYNAGLLAGDRMVAQPLGVCFGSEADQQVGSQSGPSR